MQTYFMIGAGGTGSHLTPALLRYLKAYHGHDGSEYQLVIADGDIFEEKNTERQLFEPGFVTINKAEAMLQMNPGHPIIAISRFLGKADIEDMVADTDIVLICADNYSIRRLIVDHCKTLENSVVINGGNQLADGSVQLWVRRNGENLTPSLVYGHPEITFTGENDRSAMSCQEVAALPGGEQTILANMTSATFMLTALQRYHSGDFEQRGHGKGWTELQFDLLAGVIDHIDMRERRNWATA